LHYKNLAIFAPLAAKYLENLLLNFPKRLRDNSTRAFLRNKKAKSHYLAYGASLAEALA
jgi:hypothetical protein